MALYTGRLSLADALLAPMTSDRADGLCQRLSSTNMIVRWACATQPTVGGCRFRRWPGHLLSRRRGLWRKGEQSGHSQTLLAIDLDCDRDVTL